ncbi:DoxX [Halalkalicoccus paucihalophilus]|uniref:DoxX n=1 Tax=Halalkalicoccus paucihalophilus TaxID=1008153 RepID=A0A151AIR3_9EURY|nr:DoxX family protein [Halalkalicoccus paucihalophilus]KYH27513.1 DoxX [Halalkalicoccus paucihalophilus]
MSLQNKNDRLLGWSPLFIRIALGIVFLVAGIGKVFAVGPKATGMAGFAGFLASLSVPMPTLFAWLVGLLELVGGLLLLVGLFTRYAAVLLAIDMLVATWLVHLPSGFAVGNGGYEYTLVLALVSIALVFSGPGRLALEYAIFDHELLPGNRSRSEPAGEVDA